MLRAQLKSARADYLCFKFPPTKEETFRHLDAYAGRALDSGRPGQPGLGDLMLQYLTAMGGSNVESVRLLNDVSVIVGNPECKRRLQSQLEQAAGSKEEQARLPTITQLLYSCCFCLLKFASMVQQDQPQPTASELSQVTTAAARSALVLRQLEPGNPKTHFGEVFYLQLRERWQEAVGCCLRGSELGQQQRSDFFIVYGASSALYVASQHPLEVGHSTLAAALAAFEQMPEAALHRCRRLLPADWVRTLERQVEQARPLVPGAQMQLRLLQQQAGGVAGATQALRASVAAQTAAAKEAAGGDRNQFVHALDCDNCGQRAVGLRRCARCKRAQYCRWVRGRLPASSNAGWLRLLGAPIWWVCLPTPRCALSPFAPAAGSARWRTGLPTSVSAPPSEALHRRWHKRRRGRLVLLLMEGGLAGGSRRLIPPIHNKAETPPGDRQGCRQCRGLTVQSNCMHL